MIFKIFCCLYVENNLYKFFFVLFVILTVHFSQNKRFVTRPKYTHTLYTIISFLTAMMTVTVFLLG
jgi:hypothetical protein